MELWEINVQVSDLSQDDLSQKDCGHKLMFFSGKDFFSGFDFKNSFSFKI